MFIEFYRLKLSPSQSGANSSACQAKNSKDESSNHGDHERDYPADDDCADRLRPFQIQCFFCSDEPGNQSGDCREEGDRAADASQCRSQQRQNPQKSDSIPDIGILHNENVCDTFIDKVMIPRIS